MKKNSSIIIRHILEIRLKEKIFSFVDFRGHFVDYLIEKTGLTKVRLDPVRLDIASDDFSQVYFFSWEKFGFQLEAVEKFDDFTNTVNKIFDLVNEYNNYRVSNVVRIGTRSSILYHEPGDSYEGLKQKFKNLIPEKHEVFERATKSKISDTAYTFELASNDKQTKTNITMGPVSKEEVIARFLNNEKYASFSKSNGIYFDIDYFLEKETKLEPEELKSVIKKNITHIVEIFEATNALVRGED